MAIVTEIKATKKVVTQINKIEVTKKKKLRVAAYARVSTKLEEQENSYELQINEYSANCGNVMKRVPGADSRSKLWCNFNTKSSKCSLGYTDYDDVEDALQSNR